MPDVCEDGFEVNVLTLRYTVLGELFEVEGTCWTRVGEKMRLGNRLSA